MRKIWLKMEKKNWRECGRGKDKSSKVKKKKDDDEKEEKRKSENNQNEEEKKGRWRGKEKRINQKINKMKMVEMIKT